jgi:Protein of unknown function (DUF3617)
LSGVSRPGVATGVALALLTLTSCSGNSADKDGNGVVDGEERSAEMDYDAFIPMKAGLWETKFVFTDIDVPALNKSQKQDIMDEVAKSASSRSCLTAEEAKKPGADFFGGDGADKCLYKAFDVSGQNVRMKLSCGMDGMGSIDMALAGVMGETEFNYDSEVDLRLPMIGKVRMKGNAIGKHVGSCPAA